MRDGELHLKHGVYLDHVAWVLHPDEYQSRLREMFRGAFRHLRLMALDPYDLALTKLDRNSERDRSDVRHLARFVPFDLNILRERYIAEMRPYRYDEATLDGHLELWIEIIEEDRAKTSLE